MHKEQSGCAVIVVSLRWIAPTIPVEKNAQAFLQWGIENNYPAIGFYSAYPGLSVQDIKAPLADRKSHSGHAA